MNTNGLEIAIIGMAGRFPGASDLESFWQNLAQGVESIVTYSDADLQQQGVDPDLLNHPDYVKAGAPLEAIEWFDAEFFGISPREAEILDPQQRLFLECAWEALEHAGYDSMQYSGSVGIYAGVAMNSYLLNLYTNPSIRNSVSPYQIFLANDKDFLTTRVSYKLNLNGPSVTIQTACSTSLVAVHLACQSLLSGECDLALAGGVAVSQPVGYLYQAGGIYSPDGRCRAFDVDAQGTVSGSGLGIVVLKRLEDALRDGDSIDAVIKGSAINNDGSQKVSYTAPSLEAQASVIRSAHLMAEITPDQISYLEAHGTGTALGDPIELAALIQVFQSQVPHPQSCAIGSLKPNIGHLDTAAGIASLIKTTLALRHRQLPPSLHFQQPNPNIDLVNSPFFVNTRLRDWQNNGRNNGRNNERNNAQNNQNNDQDKLNERNNAQNNQNNDQDKLTNSISKSNIPKSSLEEPLYAGVSSFGIGGTNAHVILESAPTLPPSSSTRSHQLLLLSAKTPTALEVATRRLAAHLQHHPTLSLADIAYTLQVGRRAFEYRRMVVVPSDIHVPSDHPPDSSNPDSSNPDSPKQALAALSQPPVPTTIPAGTPSVVFLFPGQGSQYPGMGYDLYQGEPTFRSTLDQCCDLLQPHLNLDLRTLLYPSGLPDPAAVSTQTTLTQTAFAQPALFVLEYALAQLWCSWGIQPAVLIGHSIGEYVAACLAGVFSLEDALKLVAVRGQLMQQQPPGVMLSVALSEAALQVWLTDELSLAAHNAPELCVVAGSEAAIAQLQQQLTTASVACRLLHTSHAFHSPLMAAAQQPLQDAFQTVALHPPQIPLISNRTGTWMTAAEATNPQSWAEHLRQPVRFAEGITTLLQGAERLWLEVGSGHTLSTLVKQTAKHNQVNLREPIACLPSAGETQSDVAKLLEAVGQLWINGLSPNWSAFYAQERRYRVPLPTYPFERQRYWVEPQPSSLAAAPVGMPNSSMFKSSIKASTKSSALEGNWFYVPVWQREHSTGNRADLEAAIEAEKCCWLVLTDSPKAGQAGLGQRLIEQLEQFGQDVVTVAVGTQFAQVGYRTFMVHPERPEDYQALRQDLSRRELLPHRILYLWNLEPETFPDLGFYGLVNLTQAFIQPASEVRLTVITQQAQDVTGEEQIHISQAKSLGFCLVIRQEYTHCFCQCIDIGQVLNQPIVNQSVVNQSVDSFDQEMYQEHSDEVHQILSELFLSEQSIDNLWIAYRGRYRWQLRYELINSPEPISPIQTAWTGHYLVVGDFDTGLGSIWAEQLARLDSVKLTLIGEHPPARFPFSSPLSLSANTTDTVPVQRAIEQAVSQQGRIRGVFYSTPMSNARSMGLIADLNRDPCDYSFQQKVQGLQVLIACLQPHTPDFVMVQSSLSSLVGGIGLGAYAAANRAVDALVQCQASSQTRWYSVNWDAVQAYSPVNITSGSQGDALNNTVETSPPRPTFGTRLDAVALTPDEAWFATQHLLTYPAGQVVVCKTNLTARIQQSVQPPLAPESHSRPSLTSPYVAPQTEMEQQIAQIWQELLGIDRIGIHDNFFELGGHSLLAIQAIARLRDGFQVELPLRNFLFEAPTVAGIAALISNQQPNPEDLAVMAEILHQVQSLDTEPPTVNIL